MVFCYKSPSWLRHRCPAVLLQRVDLWAPSFCTWYSSRCQGISAPGNWLPVVYDDTVTFVFPWGVGSSSGVPLTSTPHTGSFPTHHSTSCIDEGGQLDGLFVDRLSWYSVVLSEEYLSPQIPSPLLPMIMFDSLSSESHSFDLHYCLS